MVKGIWASGLGTLGFRERVWDLGFKVRGFGSSALVQIHHAMPPVARAVPFVVVLCFLDLESHRWKMATRKGNYNRDFRCPAMSQ